MSLLAKVGPRHIQALSAYIPSLAAFGSAAGATFLFFSEWRVIVDYIPYYNGKFPPQPEEST